MSPVSYVIAGEIDRAATSFTVLLLAISPRIVQVA
jgi:hypothetical protein